MAATTMRRKGSGGAGDLHLTGGGGGGGQGAGSGTAGALTSNSTTSHGKRGSVSSTRSGGNSAGVGGGRQRHIDPSLMMSTKEGQNENSKQLHAHVRNKSSDRLHRIGGGNSSTNLSHSKRSKSYSQIMNAAAQHGSGKSKMKRGKSEGQAQINADDDKDEDEGWTSADQTNSSDKDDSKDQSEDEADEGLTFGKKKDKGKGKEKSPATPQQGFKIPSDSPRAPERNISPSPSTTQADKTPLAKPLEPIDDEPTTLVTSQPESEQPILQTTGMPDRQPSEEILAVVSGEESIPAASNSPEQLTKEKLRPTLSRQNSTSSTRTLTGESSSTIRDNHRGGTSSPMSTRSARKRLSLLPRESSVYAAPQLSTEYAFAGGRQKSSKDNRRNDMSHRASDPNLNVVMAISPSQDRSTDSMPQYKFGTADPSLYERRRKSSVSSTRSSFINLQGVLPSLGTISHDSANAQPTGAQTSRALEAMQRASIGAANYVASQSAFTLPHDKGKGRRVLSFEAGVGYDKMDHGGDGTGTIEAARLANKLRMTRGDSVDEGRKNAKNSSSASRMLASSGSKYFTFNRKDGPVAKSWAKYKKPTISVFVNRRDDFKSVEKEVESGSLFDENFTRANLNGENGDGTNDEESILRKKAKGKGKEIEKDSRYIRYVMDYGLSGPAIQKTPTTQAILSTCIDNDEFESSWAPALTHAAGLGDSGNRGRIGGSGRQMNEIMGPVGLTGGVFINGPNATPLHFLHGLTNTNDSPFPLDETDMDIGAMKDEQAMIERIAEGGEYVDAKNLRAIALTWAALNATKNHIVTRRYVDPMRESLQRVSLAGGMKINSDSNISNEVHDRSTGMFESGVSGNGGNNPNNVAGIQNNSYMNASGHHSNTAASGMMTPGGSALKWGWRHLFPEHGGQ